MNWPGKNENYDLPQEINTGIRKIDNKFVAWHKKQKQREINGLNK